MRTYAGAASGAAGLVALTVGLAGPAHATPTPVGSAQDVVRTLEASGFEVVLNSVGAASLDNCAVTAVRPGPVVADSVTTSPDFISVNPSITRVYVDVDC